MQIFIQLPEGVTIVLEVEANDTIENVESKIQEQTGIDPADQSLTFGAISLAEGQTLSDYGIAAESTLTLSGSVATTTTAPTTTAPTTTAPTTTAPTTTAPTVPATSTTTSAAEETTTAVETTTAPAETTTTVAVVASGTLDPASQLPVTGGSEIVVIIGILLVVGGTILQRLSRRFVSP